MSTDLQSKLTAKDAAILLKTTPNTILVYAKTGKIPYTKVLSRYYFDRSDILNLIKPVKPHNDTEQQLA